MTDTSVWEACTRIRARKGLGPCRTCPERVDSAEGEGMPLCRSVAEAAVDQEREWD